MKIQFNNYTYTDLSNDDKSSYDGRASNKYDQYKYDENHANELWNSGNYEDYFDYVSKYQSDDEDLRNLNNARIDAARLQVNDYRKKMAHLWENDKNTYYAAEFLANKNGNLKAIYDSNPIAKEYVDARNSFGNQVDEKGNVIKANRFSISFAPEKRTGSFLWWKNADWLAKDNMASFENVLRNGGFTEEQLKKGGVNISRNTQGGYNVDIDKNNPYFAPLLEAIYGDQTDWTGDSEYVKVRSYDAKGNEITQDKYGDTFNRNNNDSWVTRLFSSSARNNYTRNARILYRLNADAKAKEKEFANSMKNNEVQQTIISDAILDTKDFKYKTQAIETAINMGWFNDNIEIYYNSGDDAIERLEYTQDDNTISSLHSLLAAFKDNVEMSMLSDHNGNTGTLFSIDATKLENSKIKKGTALENLVKNGITKIWLKGYVPSYLTNEYQKDTYHSSLVEANAIKEKKYYNYNLSDGRTLDYDYVNRVYFTKDQDNNIEYLSERDATNAINIDKLLKKAPRDLYSKFVDSNGNLSAPDRFDSLIKNIALYSVNEMYPDILPDLNSEVFELTNDGDRVASSYASEFLPEEMEKLNMVFNLYNKLAQTKYLFNNYTK